MCILSSLVFTTTPHTEMASYSLLYLRHLEGSPAHRRHSVKSSYYYQGLFLLPKSNLRSSSTLQFIQYCHLWYPTSPSSLPLLAAVYYKMQGASILFIDFRHTHTHTHTICCSTYLCIHWFILVCA